MAIDRSWSLGAAVGGVLLGVLSIIWLSTSVELIVSNARCCLWTSEGDARRGIFYATMTGSFQLATLAVATAVVRHRAQRAALAVIVFYVAITVVLMSGGGANEVRLWLNLIALVVAGLAMGTALRAPAHTGEPALSSAHLGPGHGVPE